MITGKQYIGNALSGEGEKIFYAVNPGTGKNLPGRFFESTEKEVDQAVIKAEQAFQKYRKTAPEKKAFFLENIAEAILESKELIQRCSEETGLPEARLLGERSRTVNQLKLFAD